MAKGDKNELDRLMEIVPEQTLKMLGAVMWQGLEKVKLAIKCGGSIDYTYHTHFDVNGEDCEMTLEIKK